MPARSGGKSSLPGELRGRDPAILVATWFGTGLLPIAPATWGSLAALPFAWGLVVIGGPGLLIAAAGLLFALGVWAAARYAQATGIEDARPIVVDEVVGQWLTLAVVPPDLALYAIGFVLFRILDIAKPFPANRIDRNTHGGLMVMADDVVAAAYGAPVLWLIATLLGM